MKLAVIHIALLFLFGLPADAAPKYRIRWVVAHGPFNLIEEATTRFAERVKAESKGEIEVDVVVPDGFKDGLSDPFVTLQRLNAGEFEMSQIYTTQIGGMDRRLLVFDMPFLFRNHQHASAVLDGPIGRKLLDGMAEGKRNFRGLSFTYSGGYRVVALKDQAVGKLEDFKGLRIAPMGRSSVFQRTMKVLGAKSVWAEKGDISAALSSGKIDGFETTYTRFGDQREGRLTKTLSETFHSLHLTSIIVNEKFFRSLPQKYRDLLRRAAQEAAVTERAVSVRSALEYKENRVKPSGVKVVETSEEERARMKQALTGIENFFTDSFPYSLVQSIRDTPDQK